MKLAMGLLNKNKVSIGERYAYHTLIESSTHFQKFHKSEHPI